MSGARTATCRSGDGVEGMHTAKAHGLTKGPRQLFPCTCWIIYATERRAAGDDGPTSWAREWPGGVWTNQAHRHALRPSQATAHTANRPHQPSK